MTSEARIMSAVHMAEGRWAPEYVAEVRRHAMNHEERLAHVAKASAGEAKRRLEREQNLTLRSYSSRLTCLVRALKEEEPSWAEIQEMATGLKADADPGEPVHVWAQMKDTGAGWRPICSFGPKRRALQLLCRDILVAKFGDEPVDYMRKNRGADVASDRLVQLVEEGYRFVVLVDIENCFRSVQHGGLPGRLGLRGAVVRNCLTLGPHVPLSLSRSLPSSTSPSAFDEAVRQGLPQGSRASSFIASLLLGPDLGLLAPADRIVLYGDDIAVAARTKGEADALSTALSEALASHPAGPFRLKRHEVAHINDGFDFLKYRHRKDVFTSMVRRRPATKSYARFYARTIAIVQTESVRVVVRQVVRYRQNWMKAFPRWRPSQKSKIFISLEMERRVRKEAPKKWWRLLRGRSDGGWR